MGVEVGVGMGVGCPCPSVCNDIVTSRHLFFVIPHLPTRPRQRGSIYSPVCLSQVIIFGNIGVSRARGSEIWRGDCNINALYALPCGLHLIMLLRYRQKFQSLQFYAEKSRNPALKNSFFWLIVLAFWAHHFGCHNRVPREKTIRLICWNAYFLFIFK